MRRFPSQVANSITSQEICWLFARVLSSPEDRSTLRCCCLPRTVSSSGEEETCTVLQLSLYLEHLLRVQMFYTDLILSHFSTNFSLGKRKGKRKADAWKLRSFGGNLPGVAPRETSAIKSAKNKTHWNPLACNSLCFKNSVEHIIDAQ